MGQVRNVSGEPRYVPELNRVVGIDEVTDVPDDRVEGYEGQSGIWEIVAAAAVEKGGK